MMRDLSRRDFLVAVAAAASTAGVRAQPVPLRQEAPAGQAVPSLKDACRGVFLIGTAFDFRTPAEFTPAEINFIKAQFNAITPENSMKPGPVHPQEESWNWTPPDTLVQFGQENDIRTFGHTLVWHSQTNPWFFDGATRDTLLARLKNHIHTLVGRYKGKMSGWDVVNEAINDGDTGGGENLRESQWLKIVGPDFLTQAFTFAREADPAVPLLYNDYSIESGAKHQSSLRLLRRLIAEGAPITGVGIQGHWSLQTLTPQKYQRDRAGDRKLQSAETANRHHGTGCVGDGHRRRTTRSRPGRCGAAVSGAPARAGRRVRQAVHDLRQAPCLDRSRDVLGAQRSPLVAQDPLPARLRRRLSAEAGAAGHRRCRDALKGIAVAW